MSKKTEGNGKIVMGNDGSFGPEVEPIVRLQSKEYRTSTFHEPTLFTWTVDRQKIRDAVQQFSEAVTHG